LAAKQAVKHAAKQATKQAAKLVAIELAFYQATPMQPIPCFLVILMQLWYSAIEMVVQQE